MKIIWILLLSNLAFAANIEIKRKDVLVFFGDSNTEWGTYTKIIDSRLKSCDEKLKVRVVNAGVSSMTAKTYYEGHFPGKLKKNRRIDVAFFLFGLNDIAWGGETRPEALAQLRKNYLDNLKLMIEEARSKGARVVLLSYPMPELHDGIPALREWYLRALSENTDVFGIDLYTPFENYLAQSGPSDEKVLHQPDGGHHNELGNKLMADVLWSNFDLPESCGK